jgi:hypothetical protein
VSERQLAKEEQAEHGNDQPGEGQNDEQAADNLAGKLAIAVGPDQSRQHGERGEHEAQVRDSRNLGQTIGKTAQIGDAIDGAEHGEHQTRVAHGLHVFNTPQQGVANDEIQKTKRDQDARIPKIRRREKSLGKSAKNREDTNAKRHHATGFGVSGSEKEKTNRNPHH